MSLSESIRVALDSIRANLLRSILTTLGIMIGITAVIAVVAVGQGGQQSIMKEMEKFGSNLFQIRLDWRRDELPSGTEFTMQDIEIIKANVPELEYLLPCADTYSQVKAGNKAKSAQISGTEAGYACLHPLEISTGRFFSDSDCQSGRRVAVIDEELARELFPRSSALGKKILVGNQALLVCGLFKAESSPFAMGIKFVYIPTRVWLDIYPDGGISYIEGGTRNPAEVKTAMQSSIKILERRHRSENLYQGVDMEQQIQAVNKVTGVMTLVIGIIAGFSLLVGGIGVMNIMLVSVTERTREIGLRMALGARRRDILLQFLIEAIVLCLLGGITGMALGVGGAFLISALAQWPPLVSWATVLLAFAFSAAIGIIFGLLPANQAANLDPIEALRRD
ncbi:ABC transporter permease [Syntrophomonas wolfei]|uniref:ABC transporter permease n=1 Tax=Syntrophomonas wolfei TaxID=863 RepID=UPI00077313B7|nr:ABC transporter permease [Syntrophomonas wolfei]